MSRDFALYAAVTKPAKQGAHRWPRTACFTAALIVSLGLWIAFFKAAAHLFGS
jgi:hypothetical protein